MQGAPDAAGGVVFDALGQVLLVEPHGHYGGYVWTYPKGRLDAGESFEDAAVREVREESGVTAELVRDATGAAVLIGSYAGSQSQTRYYLMRAIASGAGTDFETQSVRFVDPDEAPGLIRQTHHAVGRERDLRVLSDALELRARYLSR